MAKEYQCDSCGAALSKSGYYSAKKRGYCRACKPSKSPGGSVEGSPSPNLSTEGVGFMSSDPNPPPVEERESIPVGEGPAWMDFDFTEGEESTENLPTALKMLSAFGGGEKKTPEQIQMMHTTNLEILRMGLTATDVLITKYGKAVMLDDEYECRHSDEDKSLVAQAQYTWMIEKGIDPSSLVGTGAIAAALTGYYIVPPVLKVRKKAKVRLFKNAGRIWRLPGKIPVIGRFFNRRKKEVVLNE